MECESVALWIVYADAVKTTRDRVESFLQQCLGPKRVVNARTANCWMLLTTALHSDEDLRDIVAPESTWLCENFMSLDKEEDKIGVGFALGVLFCATRSCYETVQEYDGGSELSGFLPIDDVLDAMHEDKALKSLLTIVDTGRLPSEKLTFLKQDFEISEYREIVLLRFLRQVLGGAFYFQLASNIKLHSRLGIQVEQKAASTKLSGVEKRMVRGILVCLC